MSSRLMAGLAIGSLLLTGCSGGAGNSASAASASGESASQAAIAAQQGQREAASNDGDQSYEDTGTVIRVIDGDTVDATVNGAETRIRLLNIDTPETKHPNEPIQCLGPEATEYLESRLAPGDEIGLEYDVERLDRYGRTLAGVYESGTLVNADIAAMGLGVAVLFEPNRRFYQEVLEAQKKAEDQGAGLFNPAIDCTLPGQLAGPLAPLEAAPVDPTSIATAAAALASIDVSIKTAKRLIGLIGSAVPGPEAANRPLYGVNKALGTSDAGRAQKALASGQKSRASINAKLEKLQAAAQAKKEAAERKAAAAAEAKRQAAAAAEAKRQAVIRAEAQRKAAVAAEAERKAAAAAEARRQAAAAEAARQAAAAEAARRAQQQQQQQQQQPRQQPSNPYPGYTGPRCYAPGGQSWKPCP
ncbi:micrococcal nuclease [Neomicrococcus aestuarii]|uniref:Micrococcal nuclease n=1 Tax=Neomicrococcus aestuarii TaxID=556325 RepID=A0A7W8TRT1_9MICC|nr:thermonuclease family protein [Neomicrococcus aestuarii]MBB5511751.1 micrococcal nuclease [Neomicrococcus aestuarii]